jgi:hypothetical protein
VALAEITSEIMDRLREMIGAVRGEPAPPLWDPAPATPKPEAVERADREEAK